MTFKNCCLVFYYTKPNKNSFLALVGAMEKDPHFDDLDIFFIENKKDLKVELSIIIPRYSKIIIGFSLCTPQITETIPIINKLRKSFVDKNLIFVAGGPHPSGDTLGTLKIGFDVVVIGEGEETFGELLKKINSNEDYSNTKGLAFLRNSRYIFTGIRKNINLDDYPPFAEKHKKFGHIEITRGCPWGCKYCQTSYLFGRNIRHRSISNICKHVEILLSNRLTDIRFITPNSLAYGSPDGRKLNLEALENLLRSVRKIVARRGRIFFGTFPSEVRPDFVNNDTLELITTYADNDNIIIGAQTGSQRILEITNRGHSVEDIYRVVELTLKTGLKANVDFIFGLPGETKQDTFLTLKVAQDLANMGARIHGHTFMPLAGTPYAKASPGKLDKKTRVILRKMVSQGKLYGYWEKQESIATTITQLRDSSSMEYFGYSEQRIETTKDRM